MSDTAALASTFPIFINTGTTASPTWVRIAGVQTLTYNPATSEQDVSTFDDDGWDTHIVTGRGASYTVDGLAKYDAETGEQDAGQAAVEATTAHMGADAAAEYLIHLGPTGDGLRFTATATVTSFGGANKAPATWKAELKQDGAALRGPLAAG